MKSNLFQFCLDSKSAIIKPILILSIVFTINSCSSSNEVWDSCLVYNEVPLELSILSVQYFQETDQLIIEGNVSDAETQEPHIGATVLSLNNDQQKFSQYEATTNVVGYFKIILKYSGQKLLKCSYPGYADGFYELKDIIKQYFKLDSEQ